MLSPDEEIARQQRKLLALLVLHGVHKRPVESLNSLYEITLYVRVAYRAVSPGDSLVESVGVPDELIFRAATISGRLLTRHELRCLVPVGERRFRRSLARLVQAGKLTMPTKRRVSNGDSSLEPQYESTHELVSFCLPTIRPSLDEPLFYLAEARPTIRMRPKATAKLAAGVA